MNTKLSARLARLERESAQPTVRNLALVRSPGPSGSDWADQILSLVHDRDCIIFVTAEGAGGKPVLSVGPSQMTTMPDRDFFTWVEAVEHRPHWIVVRDDGGAVRVFDQPDGYNPDAIVKELESE